MSTGAPVRMLDRYIGSEETVASLKAALLAGSLPHALLLCAPDGCGRNFAARLLAADYLYPEGGTAAEAVLRGESSEVLVAAGEGAMDMIPVDRIRAIRRDIHLSSLSAAGRVVLIRDAHKMAAPAANALLKVLEEPPAGALFILTAQSPASLMPTITSRCSAYKLAPLEVQQCGTLLAQAAPAGTGGDVPALLAALYGGRYGMGLRALQSPWRLAVIRDALQAAAAAVQRNAYELMVIFARYEGRGEGERDRRTALLADMADVLSAGLNGITAPGLPALPPGAAGLLMAPLADAGRALHGNAAPKTTFTALAVAVSRAGL